MHSLAKGVPSATTEHALADLTVPADVKELIEAQLARLSDQAPRSPRSPASSPRVPLELLELIDERRRHHRRAQEVRATPAQ